MLQVADCAKQSAGERPRPSARARFHNYIERKTPPLTILWIETKLVYHLPPHLSSQIGDTMQGLNEHRFGNAIIEDARLRFLDAIEIDELEV